MIDFTKSKQYTLSIRLSTDGFSFSIYNPIHDDSLSIIEKGIDASSSLTANLKTLFHESDFLNHPYKRVNIMMAGKRFTIVPLELFEEEQQSVFFQIHIQTPYTIVETEISNVIVYIYIIIVFIAFKSEKRGRDEAFHPEIVIIISYQGVSTIVGKPIEVIIYRYSHINPIFENGVKLYERYDTLVNIIISIRSFAVRQYHSSTYLHNMH